MTYRSRVELTTRSVNCSLGPHLLLCVLLCGPDVSTLVLIPLETPEGVQHIWSGDLSWGSPAHPTGKASPKPRKEESDSGVAPRIEKGVDVAPLEGLEALVSVAPAGFTNHQFRFQEQAFIGGACPLNGVD